MRNTSSLATPYSLLPAPSVPAPSVPEHFLLAGLLIQRVAPLSAESMRRALEWGLELLSEGEPIPPLGILADVGHLALDPRGGALQPAPRDGEAALPASLVRRYEDDVLGRLLTDDLWDRASAALSRYRGREQSRAIAFLWTGLARRAGFEGVVINPALVRGLLARRPAELSQSAVEAQQAGAPHIVAMYEALCDAFRRQARPLAPEDLFELERGTAVVAFGQRVALRQTLQAADALEAGLADQPPRFAARAREVASPLFEEDVYPVGGFSSISTRGSLESLLHSQLAYMDDGERPDLFDVKYIRDELLYYSRDENLFLHPRRNIAFVFAPDLTAARIKDAGLPWQQIILASGLVVAVIRRLTAWLSEESLTFDLVFNKSEAALTEEREVFSLIFQEEIALGRVRLRSDSATRRERTQAEAAIVISTTPAAIGRSHLSLLVAERPQLKVDGSLRDPNGWPVAWVSTHDTGQLAWVETHATRSSQPLRDPNETPTDAPTSSDIRQPNERPPDHRSGHGVTGLLSNQSLDSWQSAARAVCEHLARA